MRLLEAEIVDTYYLGISAREQAYTRIELINCHGSAGLESGHENMIELVVGCSYVDMRDIRPSWWMRYADN